MPPSNSKNNKPARSYAPTYSRTYGNDEHVLISLAASPFRGLQSAYRFFSGVKGSGVVASIMSVYCAGLSIEAIMVATPVATSVISGIEVTEEMKRSRRFMPKPYVNDGAELGRLNPIPNIQRAILSRYFQWLPFWIKGNIQSDYWTVWSAPGILALSTTIALMIQRFESLIWRKKSRDKTLAEFKDANATKKVYADPDAIALAAYRAKQHNSQGAGGVIGTFVAVVLLYGLEIAAFFGSFSGAGAFAINAIYAGLTICGFEVFDRMTETAKEEQ